MSITCTEVEDSALLKTVVGDQKFVRAQIDAGTAQHLQFPHNYEFTTLFLPKKYANVADRLHNFQIRADDVWVVTFPKAGTTWIQNIVWQLKNNLDFSANYLNPVERFLERTVSYDLTADEDIRTFHDENEYNELHNNLDQYLEEYEKQDSPRLFKSHLPAHLLPKDIWTVKPKVIYVYRDAKDVAISMYHMFRNLKTDQYGGTLEEFCDLFLDDMVIYAPFNAHVNGFRQLDHFDHVLLINYEEMSVDPVAGIKKISEFLECSYSDDQLKQLTEHASFHNMRNNFNNSSFLNDFK